jgi:hypothetical protein
MIRRIVAIGATTDTYTTDTHKQFQQIEASDDTASGDKDGKHSVQQREGIDRCVLAGD